MQSLFIFLAIVLGILIPAAHQLTFLIRYFLMGLLFFSFLKVRFRRDTISWQHLLILGISFSLSLVLFLLLRFWDEQLALAIFVIAIAPTAAVAPVIAPMLRTRIDFVAAAVVLSNPVTAVVLPFILPLVITTHEKIAIQEVLIPVTIVVFLPLAIALLIRRFLPRALSLILYFTKLPFILFCLNVFIASAQASYFVRNDQSTPLPTLFGIGLSIIVLCVLLFQLGEWIGRRQEPMASSLALGRKNTMFALWIALTFISPIAALGPMFYILAQNAYNGWQMWQIDKKATSSGLP